MSQRAMSINDSELNKMYARIAMVKAKTITRKVGFQLRYRLHNEKFVWFREGDYSWMGTQIVHDYNF